ncbi:MAG TPA: CcdB family protein, partial [Rhodopila sp.]|nr:CcdB family protein [Rhodopila sp.]
SPPKSPEPVKHMTATWPNMAAWVTLSAMPNNPRWLDLVRHHVRGFRAPYLLVLQHHDIPASTRLVAPVTPPLPGDADVLAPIVRISGQEHRVRLLDISAVPLRYLSETVETVADAADAILGGLDIILHGYPAGRARR